MMRTITPNYGLPADATVMSLASSDNCNGGHPDPQPRLTTRQPQCIDITYGPDKDVAATPTPASPNDDGGRSHPQWKLSSIMSMTSLYHISHCPCVLSHSPASTGWRTIVAISRLIPPSRQKNLFNNGSLTRIHGSTKRNQRGTTGIIPIYNTKYYEYYNKQ